MTVLSVVGASIWMGYRNYKWRRAFQAFAADVIRALRQANGELDLEWRQRRETQAAAAAADADASSGRRWQ